MSIVHEAIYRCNAIPIKLTMVSFTELEQILSVCMETQKNLNSQPILRKKNRNEGNNHTEFSLYYKATIIKTVWYWHIDRNTDQWNKIESPEINPRTYGHLIFDMQMTSFSSTTYSRDCLFSIVYFCLLCQR